MCPNCRAPFVAPPAPPNIDLAANVGSPTPGRSPSSTPARRRPWWPVILALCLAMCGLVGIVISMLLPNSPRAPQIAAALEPQSMLQIETPAKTVPVASVAGAEPDQGVFHVQTQAQKPPVIAIANGSDVAFRLQLENQAGAIQTEWISPRSEREIVVQAGYYQALIDAPSNQSVKSATGRVQVKDFHHYEADFFIGQATKNQSFYIGD